MNTATTALAADAEQRLQRLQSYLDSDPANVALRAELVDLLLDTGRLQDARQHLEAALANEPADAGLQYRLAVVEHGSGQLEHAAALLQGLVDGGITAPAVLFELARVRLGQGQLQEALALLQALAGEPLEEPLASQAALLQVRTLHQAGDLNAAIALAESITDAHRRRLLRPALATLYLDAQRLDDARRMLEAARSEAPLNAELLAVEGFLALEDANPQAAELQFQQSIAASHRMGRAHLGLGLARATTGNLKGAREALSDATLHMPGHLGSWHALAWMHLVEGELDAAQRVLEEVLEKDRNFSDTHAGLAVVAALRGEGAKAEQLLRAAAKLDPSSATVAAAHALLESGARSLKDPAFVRLALGLVQAQNPALRSTLSRLLQPHLQTQAGA